jgi:hypothetical protein
MSKRSFDESRGSQPSEAEHNGLLPLHELLSPDEQEHDPTPPAGQSKKPRNFIATVVCHCGVPHVLSVDECIDVGVDHALMGRLGVRDVSLEEDTMRRVPTEVWAMQVPGPGLCL